jgi:putative Mn2+ efflux pump MntP
MESLINLVAAISSHAERVSLAIGNSSHREMEQYLLAFVGLVCLAFTAGILTGFGAVRGMTAFFFASAVYFYIGGILLALAGLLSIVTALSALLSLAVRSSAPLPKSAAPSDLPSPSTTPPSSSKPKRSACMPSQISLF